MNKNLDQYKIYKDNNVPVGFENVLPCVKRLLALCSCPQEERQLEKGIDSLLKTYPTLLYIKPSVSQRDESNNNSWMISFQVAIGDKNQMDSEEKERLFRILRRRDRMRPFGNGTRGSTTKMGEDVFILSEQSASTQHQKKKILLQEDSITHYNRKEKSSTPTPPKVSKNSVVAFLQRVKDQDAIPITENNDNDNSGDEDELLISTRSTHYETRHKSQSLSDMARNVHIEHGKVIPNDPPELTRICIRDIPTYCTIYQVSDELKTLFQSYGQIRHVYCKRKGDTNFSSGFAYVEFGEKAVRDQILMDASRRTFAISNSKLLLYASV
jgi:hypothetical protein